MYCRFYPMTTAVDPATATPARRSSSITAAGVHGSAAAAVSTAPPFYLSGCAAGSVAGKRGMPGSAAAAVSTALHLSHLFVRA